MSPLFSASAANLFPQVEVNVGVLWEGPRDDPAQVKTRCDIVSLVTELMGHIDMWSAAEKVKSAADTQIATTQAAEDAEGEEDDDDE